MGLVLFGCWVFPKVFRKHKKNLREHQTNIHNDTKETKTTSGKPTQNNCLGVSDAPLNMGLVLFVLLVFPKVFRKPKNPSGEPQIPKKTKEHQTKLRENQTQTKFLKVSDPPLDMGLVLFGYFVFPKSFRQPSKPSGKPTIPKKTKENQNKLRENQNTKVLNGFRPTLGYGFGLVWLFRFSRRFLENQKTLRENHIYQRKPKNTNQSFGKCKQTKFLQVSDAPLDMGLVLLVFLVFPKSFRKPTKPSGKPQIPKKTKENQNKLRENQHNKVFEGFRPTLGYGFGLVWLFWFSRRFLDNPKNLRENRTYQRKPKKTKQRLEKTKKQSV